MSSPSNHLANQPLVSTSITQTLINAMHAAGINDITKILDRINISKADLESPDNRIGFDQQAQLWDEAFTQLGPEFSVSFALHTKFTSFNLIGFIAINSNTLGDAFEAVEKYQKTAGQGGHLYQKRSKEELIIGYDPINPESPSTQERSCAMLCANVHMVRHLIGEQFLPKRIELTMADPGKTSDTVLQDFFACPIFYGQHKNLLILDGKLADHPLPHASNELLQVMKQKAQNVLRERESQNSLAVQVASLLISSLVGQEPDKQTIAEKLHMSPRTL